MKRAACLSAAFCLVPVFFLLSFTALWAQQPSGAQTSSKNAQTKASADDQDEGEADEPTDYSAPEAEDLKKDPAKAKDAAWKMLDDGVGAAKPQPRIDALNALGTLSGDKKAEGYLIAAMKDKDVDVRLASVLAMAAMQNRGMIPQLKAALDDSKPEVEFAAAVALWKMHDHAGITLLYEVATGERKAHSGFMATELHEANKDMHSPGTLAEIGAEQGAYALMGPFGIGLDVAKMMRKSGNGNSARVMTVTLLSEDKSVTTEKTFLDALRDKDYFVRVASARELGKFRGREVTDGLIDAFDDRKPSVRDMAAASYLHSTEPAAAQKRTKTGAAKKAATKSPAKSSIKSQ